MSNHLLRATRFTSLTEAVSYLVLLFIAMPLKYFADLPLAVRYVGSAHGALFIALYLLLLLSLRSRVFSFRFAVVVGLAALLPFVPFFLDKRFRALGSRPDA